MPRLKNQVSPRNNPPLKGFAVSIVKADGNEFFAVSFPGILPAVFALRKEASKFRRDLKAAGFHCYVAPVLYTEIQRCTL